MMPTTLYDYKIIIVWIVTLRQLPCRRLGAMHDAFRFVTQRPRYRMLDQSAHAMSPSWHPQQQTQFKQTPARWVNLPNVFFPLPR